MSCWMLTIRRLEESGTALAELALTLPLLLLLLVTAVDLGTAFSAAMVANASAQAGALYGVQHPTDVSGMVAAAKLEGSGLSAMVPSAIYGCECSDGSGSTTGCSTVPTCAYNSVYFVEVDTVYNYTPLLPYPGLATSFVIQGKARMRAAR